MLVSLIFVLFIIILIPFIYGFNYYSNSLQFNFDFKSIFIYNIESNINEKLKFNI
jgi:hypothetical protein